MVIKFHVKIIRSKENRILGWKGNILEIVLKEDESISQFLSEYLNTNKIGIENIKDNIYEVSAVTKYNEDLNILFN